MVNLCNAYEKQEILPEMLELAKFAKHHIPQEHELDDPDFIDKRIFVSTYLLFFSIYLLFYFYLYKQVYTFSIRTRNEVKCHQ